MKRLLYISIFSILLATPALSAAQKIQYVSDDLRITLRTGQGNTYQIIKTLHSGTRLEVLEQTDTGYTRVRLNDGTEGWVRTQYLTEEPIARDKLAATQKELEKLKEQNTRLREEAAKLRDSNKELKAESGNLASELKNTQAELVRLNEVAGKPILLDKENRELQQNNLALEKELQIMEQENQILKDRSQREWFIAGAGVLLGGLILGLIIPKVRWKKKSSWG